MTHRWKKDFDPYKPFLTHLALLRNNGALINDIEFEGIDSRK